MSTTQGSDGESEGWFRPASSRKNFEYTADGLVGFDPTRTPKLRADYYRDMEKFNAIVDWQTNPHNSRTMSLILSVNVRGKQHPVNLISMWKERKSYEHGQ